MSGYGMLSFLDAFSGYHQIPMFQSNKEETTFIKPQGLYCYNAMPFGLKNARLTYNKLMTRIFKPLISRIVEAYINVIVIKKNLHKEHSTFGKGVWLDVEIQHET